MPRVAAQFHCTVCEKPLGTHREGLITKKLLVGAEKGQLQDALDTFLLDPSFWKAARTFNPLYLSATNDPINLNAWVSVLNLFDALYDEFIFKSDEGKRTFAHMQDTIKDPKAVSKLDGKESKYGRSRANQSQSPRESTAKQRDNAASREAERLAKVCGPINSKLVISCLRLTGVLLRLAANDERHVFDSIWPLTTLVTSADACIADEALHTLHCLVTQFPDWRSEAQQELEPMLTAAFNNNRLIGILKLIVGDMNTKHVDLCFELVIGGKANQCISHGVFELPILSSTHTNLETSPAPAHHDSSSSNNAPAKSKLGTELLVGCGLLARVDLSELQPATVSSQTNDTQQNAGLGSGTARNSADNDTLGEDQIDANDDLLERGAFRVRTGQAWVHPNVIRHNASLFEQCLKKLPVAPEPHEAIRLMEFSRVCSALKSAGLATLASVLIRRVKALHVLLSILGDDSLFSRQVGAN